MGSEVAHRRIGIVVGLAAEARIASRLGWPIAIAGGTNAAAAADAAERLVSARVEALLSLGVAGGLDPSLRPGALLVPRAVVAGAESYATDLALSRALGGRTEHILCSTPTVVATSEAKRQLHAQTGAAAVDLESAVVARVAAAHHLPFAVLRAICDPAERGLPPAALAALDHTGSVGVLRVLRALAAEPWQVPALLRLAADAAAARWALAARVRQIAQARRAA